MRGIERAALDPSMAHARILNKPIAVTVRRGCEPVRFQDRLPVLLDETDIAAGPKVVPMSDDIQRCRVGAGPRIWIILEPGDERRALRNLMRYFAVFTLKLLQKIQHRSG